MNFKEAVKDTNKGLIKWLTHDHWELGEAYRFYKQGFRDIWYATKTMLRWSVSIFAIPFIPVLYPIAIIIRMVKDESKSNNQS